MDDGIKKTILISEGVMSTDEIAESGADQDVGREMLSSGYPACADCQCEGTSAKVDRPAGMLRSNYTC